MTQFIVCKRTRAGRLKFIQDSFLGRKGTKQVFIGVDWTQNAWDALAYSRENADELAKQFNGQVVTVADGLKLR